MGTLTDKAKIFYAKCMDETAIDQAETRPVAAHLESIAWRRSSGSNGADWQPSDWSALASTLAKLHALDITPLFAPWSYADQHNPGANVVHVYASGLGLGSRDYYLGKNATQDRYLVAYKAYATSLLGLANLYGDESAAARAADAVLAFETKLAEIMLPRAALRRPENFYNPVRLDELESLLAPFPWAEYAGAYYAEHRGDLAVRPLPSPLILSSGTAYFRELFGVVAATPVWAVVAYLQLRLLSFAAPHLDARFVDAEFALARVTSGVSMPTERWKRCVSRTDGALGFLVGRAFVDRSFSPASRAAAIAMIAGIKTAFKDNLPALDWMDAETRIAAAAKADLVYDMIGYPEFMLNDTRLLRRYSTFQLEASTPYFEAVLASNRYGIQRNIEDLDQPVDKKRWSMTPPTVNAYYSPTKNEIVFPAGILQPPFWYGEEAVSAVNFGGIGAVIGHELTHGFDDQGANYDGHGNLTSWWPEHVKQSFDAKTKCIAAEYSHFMISTGEHVNGNLTTGENIADNGGIKMSYNAWVASQPSSARLPGLTDTTPEQLFFLSFAQVWCGTTRPEKAHQRILTDPHSPHRFRVNGVMRNSNAFAEAFGCPVGSPLNPPAAEKCVVW